MILDPVVLHAAMPASGLSETLRRSAQREFPVIDGSGGYVGLVTAGELLRARPGTTVAEVADPGAVVLAPGDSLEASGLLGREVIAAAVVASGRIIGLARATDAMLVAQRMLQQPMATVDQDQERS
jgi:CBS domain-containing protein